MKPASNTVIFNLFDHGLAQERKVTSVKVSPSRAVCEGVDNANSISSKTLTVKKRINI